MLKKVLPCLQGEKKQALFLQKGYDVSCMVLQAFENTKVCEKLWAIYS